MLFSPAECQKREQWFVDGGRCGLAHCCDKCTGHPDFKITITQEQKEKALAKANDMYFLLNESN